MFRVMIDPRMMDMLQTLVGGTGGSDCRRCVTLLTLAELAINETSAGIVDAAMVAELGAVAAMVGSLADDVAATG